ncbi:MAG: hypothetical protein A9Z00_01970 [Thermobacillus sp. ZCTH02-B1]|uniref:DUF423 domain-containing protein n=1 Tax=Thermobacillus sp. ZCTH02-B1 TaxID=1858795 RepID=UPI000B559B5F|nr:DUF423 domain-containing protein [Thermobacillus sp. ZCTH02-B1]OUM97218.1 MAG: hypothetical protein A9Z00_01970 [Thermobacillus sp. ZCTH02-B1]
METFVALGGILMAIGVALGAFGAHALKDRLPPDRLATFRTGVQYHLIHALGLIAVGILAGEYPDAGMIEAAGWLLALGIALFSGSLYVLSVKRIRWLGPVTPLGGLSFIVGWALLAAGVL